MTFNQFMKAVDIELEFICGMDSNCLADWRYRDAYDNEEDPMDVALDVLEDNGYRT